MEGQRLTTDTLRKMGTELFKLAEQLEASYEQGLILSSSGPAESASVPPSRQAMRSWAQQEYRCRRARAKVFDGGLFREPAWDMLLSLFIAHLDKSSVRVMTVCNLAQVPPTTALRWLGELESQELVTRSADGDARASNVALSKRGVAMMTEYTAAMLQKRNPKFKTRKDSAAAPITKQPSKARC